MVVKAVQNYVNLVNGLTKMTQERALATARSLLAHAGLEDVANDATGRVTKLAEEIMLASRANRELMENLVAGEVDKAAGRFGYVRTDEVEALREEIAELRASLARATTETAPPARKATAKKSAAARTAAAGFATPPAAPSRPAKKTARATRKKTAQPPLGGAPAAPGTDPFTEAATDGPDISSPLPPGPVIPNPTSPADDPGQDLPTTPIALGSAVSDPEALEVRTPVAELEVAEPRAAIESVAPPADATPPEASTVDKGAAKRAAGRKSTPAKKAAATKKAPAARKATTKSATARKTPAKKAATEQSPQEGAPAGAPETGMPAAMNVDGDADQ